MKKRLSPCPLKATDPLHGGVFILIAPAPGLRSPPMARRLREGRGRSIRTRSNGRRWIEATRMAQLRSVMITALIGQWLEHASRRGRSPSNKVGSAPPLDVGLVELAGSSIAIAKAFPTCQVPPSHRSKRALVARARAGRRGRRLIGPHLQFYASTTGET